MSSAAVLSLLSVSLMHILIPSHWLCFVVVGKAQGWRPRQTMLVAALAGALHVVTTVTIGIVLKSFGGLLVSAESLERIGAFVLVGFGLLYLVLHFLHAGHHHEEDRAVTSRFAFLALIFTLTASPCSAAIPVLVLEAQWPEIAVVGVILLLTTPLAMALLVGLAALGIEKLRFQAVERYEKLIVGVMLALLGAGLLLFDRH
jgi:putative Mn2+ efflux pump MntP